MKVIGVILMILGVLVGVYLGVWWAFIGGIVDIVDAAKATDVSGMAIALGALKILFCELIGGVPGGVLCLSGYFLFQLNE